MATYKQVVCSAVILLIFFTVLFKIASCISEWDRPPKYEGWSYIELDQVFLERGNWRFVYTEDDIVHQLVLVLRKHRTEKWQKSWETVPQNIKAKFRQPPSSFDCLVVRDLEGDMKSYAIIVWFDNPNKFVGTYAAVELHIGKKTKL